ncbi:MAG: hypothetical protein HY232_03990 [Acidobacteria bacterium]|nr:hypothetical protein [Acidobacteriota bacterium]
MRRLGNWLGNDISVSFLFFGMALVMSGLGPVPAGMAQSTGLAESLSVSGDSISRAFDADDRRCTLSDQLNHNWITGKDNGDDLCSPGPDGVFSHRERLECELGRLLDESTFNDARSGATMLRDFFSQAAAIRRNLTPALPLHYISVLQGHNDACTSTRNREVADCGSADKDPNNYCRTTPAAFERELRRGMDELIQIPNSRILVSALARISLLCNSGDKRNCILGLRCSQFWRLTVATCASLTSDCSDQRKIDMYNTTVAYNAVLNRLSAEYEAIPEGGLSPTGARKAADVQVRYVEGSFYFKYNEDAISCCDCFHPNLAGQATIAQGLWEGMQCADDSPCCLDTGDALADATCESIDTTTTYTGGFWAR